MSTKKNKYSTCVVKNNRGVIVGYLCSRDEENGLDINLNLNGYIVEVI